MWQEVAIIIIGIITLLYAGWKFYKKFIDPKRSSASCCTGCKECSLKNQQQKKHLHC